MDAICHEIGLTQQHLCETALAGRYQLICDKAWLQALEKHHKICPFPAYPQLDRRAHPADPLEHPWTRILVQSYAKQPQLKVFPLPTAVAADAAEVATAAATETGSSSLPLTYSQAVAYVANVNFRNLWEAAHKRYAGAHVLPCKPSGGNGGAGKMPNNACNLLAYDAALRELIQRIFHCPLLHCKLDRVRESVANRANDGAGDDCEPTRANAMPSECHANILPAIAAIETSTHISVFFYPPAIVTSLYDCITYSPAVLGKSYNKPLFLIYQLCQLSNALQADGLFLGDVRLHDILVRDNLWLQVVPRLEANMLQQSTTMTSSHGDAATCSPSETAATTSPTDLAAAAASSSHDEDDDAAAAAEDEEYSASSKFDLKFAYDLEQFSLREYCEMWCNGLLSNYDYLTILNNAAGRSLGNPAYHHIMPWVSDLAARHGANWRDLSKSKYRLNKGDLHLELMFTHASQQNASAGGSSVSGHHGVGAGAHHPSSGGGVFCNGNTMQAAVPHHVSDFLSEITYFVYMARRTPQHILREHVRPIWVPAEYPVSIQRLQEWTPDECIPAFYADAMIFKSIHEDLPDLEVPAWASCPEDFICKHREALESQYVSERLQHWIDLNFGYKLTGKAAIKSKNVCLSMVDQHKNLCQRGIVQLFTQPHPPKRFPSPWFNKTAPRLSQFDARSPKGKHHRTQLQPSDAAAKRRLAKSTENLCSAPTDGDATRSNAVAAVGGNSNSPRMSLRPTAACSEELTSSSAANFYHSTNFIELPKDYQPSALLQSLETMQSFCARTFPRQQQATPNLARKKMINSDLRFEQHSAEHSFTNQLFFFANEEEGRLRGDKPHKSKNLLAPSSNYLKQRTLQTLLCERRERELHALGCLIVELFAMPRLRPLLLNGGATATFESRLHACRTVAELHVQDLPKCLRYVVRLLLLPPELVSERGLPPPTAAQLLEPIFANALLPFPAATYYPTYALVRSLHAFDFAATLLELHTHFHCNGRDCARYSHIDRKRVLYSRKVAECKVMACCAHIGRLLEPVAYEQFTAVELLLPHIIDLLTAEPTSILAAWNLFDPFAQALGIAQTQKYLLLPIMQLYDVECFERGMISVRKRASHQTSGDGGGGDAGQLRFSTSSSFKSRKSVKLYHHSFLLRLIVRFGLRCFLHNFIAPLIEAVGGYKEPENGSGFHYHSNTSAAGGGSTTGAPRRTSKNLNYAVAPDEDSSQPLLSPGTAAAETELELEVLATARLSLKVPDAQPKQEIEDVFSFDDDANSDYISNAGTAENKSIDSFDMRPTTAEEAKEDNNLADVANTTPEKLAISEIIYGAKISNASFDDADKLSLKSQNATNDSPTNNGSSTTTASTHLGPKSPTIAIPASVFTRNYQLNAIDCDIGSRKSIDSFEIITEAAEEEQKLRTRQQQLAQAPLKSVVSETQAATMSSSVESTPCDSLQASVISKMSEAKAVQNNRISEMSAESLVWLSHRLGPVLSSRYITRNLLKMLSLCYVGQENLLPEAVTATTSAVLLDAGNLNYFSIADARVVGDRSAARVLECLMSIAALFGEEIILQQYFPHISELIALSTKRITGSLEGAIISTLQLLKYIVPCLLDATIMEHLKHTILNAIILPVLRLLGSTRLLMPSGYLGRSVLARKLLDAIYALCVRIGPDMSKEYLCTPALRPFFLIFDKAYGISENFRSFTDNIAVSPPSYRFGESENVDSFQQSQRENEEIRDVFGPALAHTAYLSFLRFLGEAIMQRTLLNLEFILTLCHEFEQPEYKSLEPTSTSSFMLKSPTSAAVNFPASVRRADALDAVEQPGAANSFGTHVIGNRIEVTAAASSIQNAATAQSNAQKEELSPMEVLDMVAYKFDQIPTSRHLKGNWLAYWRHEISRPEKEAMLNLKQIKLQSFVGHTNSVRSLVALDNENSFISASKDKTVKLWSLRSEGDGTKTTACQFTYTAHKKSIHSLAFLDAMRFVVSCDSGVHIWDPFIGRPLGILDSPKHNPVTVVKCLPSPSPLIVAGTAESSVRMIDARCMQYVNEWRVGAATQSYATVRCLTVAPSGNWLAVGLNSGSIVTLDTRTGMLLNSWRPMECDLLQLAAPNDAQLVSSALDHSLAVWHASDGILHYQLKPPAEPAHFLQTIGQELVFATTGNRIGVYSDIGSSHAAYSVTKLRSETFRGVLTSLAVLPLNRTFLAGNESGNIVLLC